MTRPLWKRGLAWPYGCGKNEDCREFSGRDSDEVPTLRGLYSTYGSPLSTEARYNTVTAHADINLGERHHTSYKPQYQNHMLI